MTLVIKTNPAQVADYLVRDLGYPIPGGGASVTLTDLGEIQEAQKSLDLLAALVDDAYGAGSSTLILNDGTGDIAQADAANFLAVGALPDASVKYGVVKTTDVGEIDAGGKEIKDAAPATLPSSAPTLSQVQGLVAGQTRFLQVAFEAAGPYRVGTEVGGRRYNHTGLAWTLLDVTLHRELAGSSGTTTMDVNVDGASIYNATPANRPSVTSGDGNDAVVQGGAPDTSSVGIGSYLSVDLDSVEVDGENATLVVTLSA